MKLKPIILAGFGASAAVAAFFAVGKADVQEQLAQLDPNTQDLIEVSCAAERFSPDPDAYRKCVSSEIEALSDAGGLDQLSHAAPLIQELAKSACDGLRYAGDAVGFASCVNDELAAFSATDGLPDISDMDDLSQELVRGACASQRAAGGPVQYADCLSEQREALTQIGGVADLSGFPLEARELMDTFCGTERALNGPVGYATCLQGQIVAYNQSPGMPDMSAYSPREAADIRDACVFERFSNDVGVYAECIWSEAEKLGPVIAAAPPSASDVAAGGDDLSGQQVSGAAVTEARPSQPPAIQFSQVPPVVASAPSPLLEGDAVAAIALNLPLDLAARRLPDPPSETFWMVVGALPSPTQLAVAAPEDSGLEPGSRETAPEEPQQPETPLIAGPAPNALLTVASLQGPAILDAPAAAFMDEAFTPRSPLIADVPPLEPFSSRLLASDRGPEIEVEPSFAVAEALTPADPYDIEPRTEPASIAIVQAAPGGAAGLDRDTAAPLPETAPEQTAAAETVDPGDEERVAAQPDQTAQEEQQVALAQRPSYVTFPDAPQTFSPPSTSSLSTTPNAFDPGAATQQGGREYAPEDIPSPEIRANVTAALAAVPAPRNRPSADAAPRSAWGPTVAEAPRRRPIGYQTVASTAPANVLVPGGQQPEPEEYSITEIEEALEGLGDDTKPLPPGDDLVEDIVSELGATEPSGGGATLLESSLPAAPIVAAPPGLTTSGFTPPPDDGLFLLGVLAGGGRDRALLGTADGGALRVESGDVIDGWTVGAIGDDFIKLTRGTQTRFLRLP